jgi:hypothetical protein
MTAEDLILLLQQMPPKAEVLRYAFTYKRLSGAQLKTVVFNENSCVYDKHGVVMPFEQTAESVILEFEE